MVTKDKLIYFGKLFGVASLIFFIMIFVDAHFFGTGLTYFFWRLEGGH